MKTAIATARSRLRISRVGRGARDGIGRAFAGIPRSWRSVTLVLTVVMMVWWVVLRRHPVTGPRSLQEAIMQHEKEFGAPQYVLVPLSTAQRLGYRRDQYALSDGTADRRIQVETAPCFLVSPSEFHGAEELFVQYRDQRTLRAELDKWAALRNRLRTRQKIEMRDVAEADLKLRNVLIAEAVGIPNDGGPCDFRTSVDGKVRHEVVTRQISAEADFVGRVKSGTTTLGAIKGVKGDGSGASEGSISEHFPERTTVSGAIRRVTTLVKRNTLDLGVTPARKSHSLRTILGRDEFDAFRVFVGSLEDSPDGDRLNLKIISTTDTSVKVPDLKRPCPLGEDQALLEMQFCEFVPSPGNVLIRIWWERDESSARLRSMQNKILHVEGFRTDFLDVSRQTTSTSPQ
jgi:hypothetical protein